MARKVTMIVFGLVLLCLCLTSCCGKIYYESCLDVFTFKERYMILCNDLARHAYYCGSDDHWHYFAIKRRLVAVDDVVGLKLPKEVKLPFAIRNYNNKEEQWQIIDCCSDWIMGRDANAK